MKFNIYPQIELHVEAKDYNEAKRRGKMQIEQITDDLQKGGFIAYDTEIDFDVEEAE